ncbi:MAG: hypothetical protein HDR26_05425 [Lachnospiraceae bacterium]|nr:hypothetical protein [Lachnospiraceae bacterium]
MSAVLTNVYNHYLTTYAPKGTSQFDSHKRGELRNICDSMVKLNKEAPWFLPARSTGTFGYAIGLKEHARTLRNTIASLGGLDEENLLNKKVAYSDDESVATASFIGSYHEGDIIPSVELEVQNLASTQENLGKYLPAEKAGLEPDTYSFDITINGLSYEFQFNIKGNETNRDVQERLARLVNNAGIGLTADLHESGSDTALRLTSSATGNSTGSDTVFTVSDNHTSKTAGTVEYFGLDYMSRQASNAVFLLNGERQSVPSNTFTVGKVYQVQLKGVSTEGQTTSIGLKNDVESLTENVKSLIGGYNSFLKSVDQYLKTFPKSSRLSREMGGIAFQYKSELDAMGLSLQTNNSITVDEKKLAKTMSGDNTSSQFSTIRNFASSLLQKTAQVSLDPLKYVEKTIVAYKNPGHEFISPYSPSPYSGMLFNSYC